MHTCLLDTEGKLVPKVYSTEEIKTQGKLQALRTCITIL